MGVTTKQNRLCIERNYTGIAGYVKEDVGASRRCLRVIHTAIRVAAHAESGRRYDRFADQLDHEDAMIDFDHSHCSPSMPLGQRGY